MVFISNKYARIYYQIIQRAQTRLSVSGRIEIHHIIPKCFFKTGTKSKISPGWLDGSADSISNLVKLTPREHFICHLLLVKIAPTNVAKSKMVFALTRFMHSPAHNGHITSRRYEQITKLKAEASSQMNKGRKRTAPISDETRAKLSAAAKRRKGFTPAGLAKVVESNKNRVWTEEMRQKLREHNLGKLNISQKGKPQPKLTCPHCGKTGGVSAIKHWHFDKCKSLNTQTG